MNKNTRISLALGALLVTAPAGIALAQGPLPRIPIEDARARAVREVPGSVLDEELEREHGRLVYSFEIRPNGASSSADKEVNIDATDGSVVAVEDADREDHEDDDHEAQVEEEGERE